MRFLHQFFPSDHKKPGRRRGRKSIKPGVMKDNRKTKAPKSTWAKFIWVLRLEQQTQLLHGFAPKLLCIYYNFYFNIFKRLMSTCESQSLILMPVLRSLLFQLLCPTLLWCFLTLFTVFYFVMFCCYLLEACFFYSNERQKGRGGAEGGVTTIRIYYFNK